MAAPCCGARKLSELGPRHEEFPSRTVEIAPREVGRKTAREIRGSFGPRALEGRWAIVKGELAGEPMPALMAEKTELELSAGAYLVRFGGKVADRGNYILSDNVRTTA